MAARQIACIDLREAEARAEVIAAELAHAATEAGFLQVINHGIPQSLIDAQFRQAEQFFALPDETKAAQCPFRKGANKGWEKGKQVRPSSGVPDMKESMQLQWYGMEDVWPDEDVCPGFREGSLAFMEACQALSRKLLVLMAVALQLPHDFFTKAHSKDRDDCQATMRMLHYPDITGFTFPPNYWRAAPHSDFDTITLLFQRPGQSGLEACPGAQARTAYGLGDDWTPLEPVEGCITINFGRMLTRWSDNRVKATLHRVRTPKPGEYQGPRYSIAYFNQANGRSVISSPEGSYPDITGAEFLRQALTANYESKYRQGCNDSSLLLEEAYQRLPATTGFDGSPVCAPAVEASSS